MLRTLLDTIPDVLGPDGAGLDLRWTGPGGHEHRAGAAILARHNDIEFERGGMRFTVHVPDEVQLKIELEIESDERELEIELTW
jgi:amphi-Trp domain-containing protein